MDPRTFEQIAALVGGKLHGAGAGEVTRVVTDSPGRPSHLIGITIDVTERRMLEEQITQAERVEAVSKLASRLAHDLNNILAPIMMSVPRTISARRGEESSNAGKNTAGRKLA